MIPGSAIKKRLFLSVFAVFSGALLLFNTALASVATSTSYRLQLDSVNVGGARSTSSSYRIEDTGGETGTGGLTGTSYEVQAGYQQVSTAASSDDSDDDSGGSVAGGGGLLGNLAGLVAQNPEIKNLVVAPDTTSTVISWETDEPTRYALYWGETPLYEMGAQSSAAFETKHLAIINGLDPGKEYYFRIEVVKENNKKTDLVGQIFETLLFPDNNPPANVSNLKSRFVTDASGAFVVLNWSNPADYDLAGVRVVRSEYFFPKDPSDGLLVYEGLGTEIVDKNGVFSGKLYFYTIFTFDYKENYSSGAITRPFAGIPEGEIIDISELTEELADPLIRSLTPEDLKVAQDEAVTVVEDGVISVISSEPFKFSLAADKLPNVLKSIIVTIIDPDDPRKKFSFLLRINEEKTSYEAQIAALEKEGRYPVEVLVFDFKNQAVKKIKTELVASADKAISRNFADFVRRHPFFTFIIFLIFYVWYVFRTSRKGL